MSWMVRMGHEYWTTVPANTQKENVVTCGHDDVNELIRVFLLLYNSRPCSFSRFAR